MDRKFSSKLAAGAAILIFAAGLAMAQAGRGTGRMAGNVLDPAGKPVVGAQVTAVFTQAGGSTFETTTDKKGEWVIMGVGTGNWDVTVNAKGYLPVTQRVYTSQLNKNPKFTIKLEKKSEGTGIVQDEATFQTLEEGNAFFKEGKYDTALLMYEEFLAKNPGAYQVLLNIGDCYREKGEYDKAIESYNKLITQAGTDSTMGKAMGAKGLAAIGLCYLKQDKLTEVAGLFQEVDRDVPAGRDPALQRRRDLFLELADRRRHQVFRAGHPDQARLARPLPARRLCLPEQGRQRQGGREPREVHQARTGDGAHGPGQGHPRRDQEVIPRPRVRTVPDAGASLSLPRTARPDQRQPDSC